MQKYLVGVDFFVFHILPDYSRIPEPILVAVSFGEAYLAEECQDGKGKNMEKKEQRKIAFSLGQKIIVCILVLQIIVMLLFSFIVINMITKDKKQSTTDNLKTVVEERSQIIRNYVAETEKTLTAFSRAGEVLELLKNPTDETAFKKAQKYTETFSGDVENLDGLYVSEWNSHVLTHTNPAVAGITTREGDALKSLQDSLTATQNGVYNTGIIISPASGKQVVSLYNIKQF